MSNYNQKYALYPHQSNDVIVIEQGDDIEMSNTQYYLYIVIGVVFAFFVSLLVDRFLDYEKIEKKCDTNNIGDLMYNTEQYKKRKADCDPIKKDYDTKKFVYMVVIGIFGLFIGSYLAAQDPAFAIGGSGVAFGSSMLVIYYTVVNWSLIQKDLQIVVLGLAFLALFYGSIRIYEKYHF